VTRKPTRTRNSRKRKKNRDLTPTPEQSRAQGCLLVPKPQDTRRMRVLDLDPRVAAAEHVSAVSKRCPRSPACRSGRTRGARWGSCRNGVRSSVAPQASLCAGPVAVAAAPRRLTGADRTPTASPTCLVRGNAVVQSRRYHAHLKRGPRPAIKNVAEIFFAASVMRG
jgi:hypothetical protein